MRLGFMSNRRALDHFLDQINTATWAIQLVTQHLIGRTGRCTETAMNALIDDRLNRANVPIVFVSGCNIYLHAINLTDPGTNGQD